MEEAYGTNRASSLRSLVVMEEERAINRQIKGKLKSGGGSTSKLQIPHPHVPNEYIWTEDKDEIEASIINANKKKFRLADDTPFRLDPLLSHCGTYGDTNHSDDILLGRYDASQLDEGTRIFIRHLQVDTNIMNRPPVANKITMQEFQDYWKKVRERTSSSPSGRHFGQWKAIAKSDYLSAIFTKLTSLPVESGFSPSRWCQRLECSLEKKARGYAQMNFEQLYC